MSLKVWALLVVIFLVGLVWPVPDNDKSFMGMVIVPMMIVGPLVVVAAHYYLCWREGRVR